MRPRKYPKPAIEYLRLLYSYYPITGKFTWNSCGGRHSPDETVGVIQPNRQRGSVQRYLALRAGGCYVLAHTVAWLFVTGEWPKGVIDHRDGNSLNNIFENLRDVSNRENLQNTYRHRNGKLVGCTYIKDRKVWKAQIYIDGKTRYIGSYLTELAAHHAYLRRLKQEGLV